MRNTITLTTLALGLALTAGRADTPTDTLKGHITVSKTLDTSKVWILSGYVAVDSPAVLTINPGVWVKGQKSTKGTLSIQRGAKIVAEGTLAHPITFTSDEADGQKTRGSWGGIVILGKAKTNLTGSPTFEAFSDWSYGGTDDDDSSGSMKYVRIENPGFAVAPDKELNGITMCTVGRKTKISYIQVHNGDDDGFEWFSGTVSPDHLIVTNQVDDGFDSDNGFSGTVSWGIDIQGNDDARKRIYIVKDSQGNDSTVTFPDEVVGDKIFESSSTKVASGDASPQTMPTWSHITGIDNGKSGGGINMNQQAVGLFDHLLMIGDSSAYAVKLESARTNGGLLSNPATLKFTKSYLGGTWKNAFQTDDSANAVVVKAALAASLKTISSPLYKDLSLANDTLKNDSVGAVMGDKDFWYAGWTLPNTVTYAKGLERTTGVRHVETAKGPSELMSLSMAGGNLSIRSIAGLQVSLEILDINGKRMFRKNAVALSIGENHFGHPWGKLPSGAYFLVVRSGTYSLHLRISEGKSTTEAHK